MFEKVDDKLFSRVLANDNHVLQHGYNTKTRVHNKILISKATQLNHGDFIIKMLYRHLPTREHATRLYFHV